MDSLNNDINSGENKKRFNFNALGGDLLINFFGQLVILLFGLFQTLIIPKYLSEADYGYWQLFLLYTTYVGILHLGYIDGILMRWAGKEFDEIKEEIPIAFKFLILQQFVVVGILIVILITINFPNIKIGLAVLANAIIVNLLTFFIFTYQAVKRFKLITIININKGALFLISVLVILIGGKLGYIDLFISTLVAGLISLIIISVHLHKFLFSPKKLSISLLHYGKQNIKIGFFVLLGNFIALLMISIDRVVVSNFFKINQFAYYAFALSMCSVIIIFINSVSFVFFPYLLSSSLELRTQAYHLLKPSIIILWAGALIIYFPFTVWVDFYLPRYTESLPLMATLLCTISFSSQIFILHANFFKAYLKQQLYFILAGISLVCAMVLYLIAAIFFCTLLSIAFTAVISFLLWYLLNEVCLSHIIPIEARGIIKWVFMVGMYSSAFMLISMLVKGWFFGMIFYFAFFLLVTSTLLNNEVRNLLNQIKVIILPNYVLKRPLYKQ